MNHIRAILDTPNEWRVYKSQYAKYIAEKLEGKHPDKPDHPIVWTFFALGLALFYGGLAAAVCWLMWFFHPHAMWIVGGLGFALWVLLSIAIINGDKSHAEKKRRGY